MSKISRRIFLSTGTALGVTALAGLKDVENVFAQGKKGEINLYSSRHYNTDNRLYRDFEAQTGIKVNLIEGKDTQLLERIQSEGRNSKADILITVDAGNLWRAQQSGIFVPVSSPILKSKIPAYFRDPRNHWFGFSKRVRVIMYNKAKVNPSQLSSYLDLANPKWRKKIAIRSSTNIYNQSLVAWLIAKYGQQKAEQWCRGIVANMAREPQGGDRDQIKAVAAGIADIAVANTYYLAGYGTSKDPQEQDIFKKVGVFFPNQKDIGAHVNISGAGVLKNAPNKDAAKKFLEYLVSPSAQRFFADGNNEYPVVPGIQANGILNSFGNYKSDVSGVSKYGANLANAVKIMDRAKWS
jgi:iron(III) transport system substrate-binding protein